MQRGEDAWIEFLERTENHPLGGFGIFDLTGFPKVLEWEKQYLSPQQLEKYEKSIGVYDPNVGHGDLAKP